MIIICIYFKNKNDFYILFTFKKITLMTLSKYTIDGKVLYSVKDLKQNNPKFFIGCAKTLRTIIKRKKIPNDMTVFATKTKTGWTLSSSDIKKANLFLKVEWVENNFKYIQESSCEMDIQSRSYEKIPPLIELSDDDRLKNSDGNILNIEIRGNKEFNRIYFKAIDIEKCLMCNSLRKTIHTHEKFEYGVHYETFVNIGNKKETFLTFQGFVEYICISLCDVIQQNKTILLRWFVKISSSYLCNNESCIITYSLDESIGNIYIVSAPHLDYVKIGYSKQSKLNISSRYAVYWGEDIEIETFPTTQVRNQETIIHKHFHKYNISGELFHKQYLGEYIEYIQLIV